MFLSPLLFSRDVDPPQHDEQLILYAIPVVKKCRKKTCVSDHSFLHPALFARPHLCFPPARQHSSHCDDVLGVDLVHEAPGWIERLNLVHLLQHQMLGALGLQMRVIRVLVLDDCEGSSFPQWTRIITLLCNNFRIHRVVVYTEEGQVSSAASRTSRYQYH